MYKNLIAVCCVKVLTLSEKIINKKTVSFVIALVFVMFLNAKQIKVNNLEQFNNAVKTLSAGDSIILANGVWKDAAFKLQGNGHEGNYIYMMAETAGKVFLEGKSMLQMSGEYLHVSGLVFRNGSTPKNAVVEFRTSSTNYAYNSVLSNIVIDKYSQHKDSSDIWVGLWGKNNRVEYCYFGGKANNGVTLVVWPNDSNSINNNHLITRNYFGPRPRLASNGGESIRLGTAQVCHLNSGSIVEANFFERCDGEVEIISNKSGGNKFLNNTFLECEGSLVLRHGDNAVVAGNWFIGNGKAFTGGVRIVNEGHLVYNNYFYKIMGSRFRAPLSIMNGIPNSPAVGYVGVNNVVVANNTFFGCVPWELGVGSGTINRIVTPKNTHIVNNIIYSPNEHDVIKLLDNMEDVHFDNNLMLNKTGMLSGKGLITGEIMKANVGGVPYIITNAKAIGFDFLPVGILEAHHSDQSIGAFLPHENFEMANAENCGPAWYKPAKTPNRKAKIHSVAPGVDVLANIISKIDAGDIIELAPGSHVVSSTIVLPNDIIIRSANKNAPMPMIRINEKSDIVAIFEIEGNSTVRFEHIAMKGETKGTQSLKYAFVSSRKNALGYNLIIDNCQIANFAAADGGVIKAYKGTLADTIRITNSEIKNCTSGLIVNQEMEDKGRYNAEYIHLENTVFSNISEFVIDYYRGGPDESTLGGHLYINHCVFDNVAKSPEQFIIRNHGVITVDIRNSIFSRSPAKMSVLLDEYGQQIQYCNFFECVAPTVRGGSVSRNLFFENPRFQKRSFQLNPKSKLKSKGENANNIGLK